jgi:hypothetical protein
MWDLWIQTPPPIEGAPYLARSLRQMWETTNLRSGTTHLLNLSQSLIPAGQSFAFLSVIPEGNLVFVPQKQIPFGNDRKKGKRPDVGLKNPSCYLDINFAALSSSSASRSRAAETRTI